MGILKGILTILGIGLLLYGLWFIFNQAFLGALVAVVLGICLGVFIVKKCWDL